MNVLIQSPDVKLSQQTRDNIKQRVLSGFSKFQNYIDKVELHIKDTNGPKGGDDKHCVIKMKGAKDELFVVSGQAENISHVVANCIIRAKAVVAKKAKMHRVGRPHHYNSHGMVPIQVSE